MDHLPTPTATELRITTVPLLEPESQWHYPAHAQGFKFFEEFPALHGFQTEDLATRAVTSCRHAAFLQTWAFFGLLREVFSIEDYCFDPNDFKHPTDRGSGITTKALTRYTWYWQAARAHYDQDKLRMIDATVDRCLGLIHGVIRMTNQTIRSLPDAEDDVNPSSWSPTVRVIYSVALLGDYLTNARRKLRLYTPGPALSWNFIPLEKVMKHAGWCDGELSRLPTHCNLSSRVFLAGIDRKGLGKDHGRCNAEVGCLAHQLDYKTYQTRHRPGCSGKDCRERGPSVPSIVAAIQKGGSAAVDASGVANGQDPRVVQVGGSGGTQTRYVAISHVWSDGLGNPWSNRLCSCQLNHIQALVNGLYPLDQAPVPFWIDSLGIPVGKRHIRDRQVAITRIHQTFSQADKVLVLDNYLKSCDKNAPLVEMLMRLQYSPWMTRVWTLLEGNVARNLHFQFADKAVSSDYLNGPAARQSFQVVSNCLRELPDERLWSCPSAMQLIHAFAVGSAMPKHLGNYASLPEQSDSDEEELRQTAIQLLEQNDYAYALGKEWRQFLFQSGKDSNLLECEEDTHVLTDVGTQVSCPVLTHGLNSIGSMRGVAIQEYHRDRHDMDSACFTEACGGFRSRTTSRLDDVTICIGAMLHIDLEDIVSIPTMNWRLREWLDFFDSERSSLLWVRRLGINTQRWTNTCHLERMKVFLSKVERYPMSIIFWNAPRLPEHTWAPQSLLHRDMVVYFPRVQGYARFNKHSHGLEFNIGAYLLGNDKAKQNESPSPSTMASHAYKLWTGEPILFRTGRLIQNWVQKILARIRNTPQLMQNDRPSRVEHGNEVLTIHHDGPMEREQNSFISHIRFVPNDRTISEKEKRRGWQDYIDEEKLDNLAILLRAGYGALVRVLRHENGRYIAQYIRLVEHAQREAIGPHVEGVWYNKREWCIL